MAAFIIRSIYSALKGDREAFTCFNPSSPASQVSCDSISPYFNDVLPGNVFYRYVQKLYQLGITAGCQTTTYCVNDPIANGALAVFAVRARQIVQKNCATSVGANANQLNRDACDATFSPIGPPSYLDVPTSHLWYKHIQYAREQSIIVSEQVQTCTAGPGYFCPEILAPPNNGTSTRAYMTYYLVRGILGDYSW